MSEAKSKVEFKLIKYSIPRISYSTERVPKDSEDSEMDILCKGNIGIDEEKKYVNIELELDVKEKSDDPKMVFKMTIIFEYDIIGEAPIEELSETLRSYVETDTILELKSIVEKLTALTNTNIIHLPL